MVNLWMPYAAELRSVFGASSDMTPVLVCRALSTTLSTGSLRVLDVGGGFGHLAVHLARLGHQVTVLDIDPGAVQAARERLSTEPEQVRERVTLLTGEGQDASREVGEAAFDLVCCHSVLMYESSPDLLIRELVSTCKPGGCVSIVSINPQASAMRSGLQGRWLDAIGSLTSGKDMDTSCLPTTQHSRAQVTSTLHDSGATVTAWYGIGIFTDHLERALAPDESAAALEAEWLAGMTDPYRLVARCYHLVASRTASGGDPTTA